MPRRFAVRLLTAALTAMLLLAACNDDGTDPGGSSGSGGSGSGSASGPEESETP